MKGSQAEKFTDPALNVVVDKGISATRSFTINREVSEVFQYAKNFKRFLRIMKHLDAVQLIPDSLGITEEIENTKIAWASKKENTLNAFGTILFEPAFNEKMTFVRISMKYEMNSNFIQEKWDELFGEKFDEKLVEDIRHFKQILETGEVPTTEGQPHGHCHRSLL